MPEYILRSVSLRSAPSPMHVQLNVSLNLLFSLLHEVLRTVTV